MNAPQSRTNLAIERYARERHDVGAITKMLHRAYAPLAARGMNFLASNQEADVTRRRLERGIAWVAVRDDAIVGTVACYETSHIAPRPALYDRHGVFVFAQFAVEPAFQGAGIGALLLDTVEEHARRAGARELACDTAAPAAHLLAYYAKRGFRNVETFQFPHAAYQSIILAKPLAVSS